MSNEYFQPKKLAFQLNPFGYGNIYSEVSTTYSVPVIVHLYSRQVRTLSSNYTTSTCGGHRPRRTSCIVEASRIGGSHRKEARGPGFGRLVAGPRCTRVGVEDYRSDRSNRPEQLERQRQPLRERQKQRPCWRSQYFNESAMSWWSTYPRPRSATAKVLAKCMLTITM